MKYLVIVLGAVAVLEVWGIKIGPIVAGLGLLGVAVALGAQDLFKFDIWRSYHFRETF